MAGFRFSDGAGDVNWQCCCANGTSFTNVDSGVVADTNGHQFAIEFVDATPAVKFYIDGVLVGTLTTDLPLSGTQLDYQCGASATSPAGANFGFTQVQIWSDR